MKKNITIFSILLLLSSCGTNTIITQCQEEIKKWLKDPYSVKWEENEILEEGNDYAKVMLIKQEYNAKNSYGAYTGKKTWYCNIGPDWKLTISTKEVYDIMKGTKTLDETLDEIKNKN